MHQRPGRANLIVGLLVSVFMLSVAVAPASADDRGRESSESGVQLQPNREIDSGLALSGESHEFQPDASVSYGDRDLADHGEESADFQRVFPPDTRQHISPTTHYPARTITLIEGGFSGGYNHCSGTFIGANVVLTAAHCLYNHELGGWLDSQLIVPGADGPAAPFGYQFAAWGWVPGGWIQSGNLYYDWGLLVLPDSLLGNQVGWLDMAIFTLQTLQSPNFNPGTVGYPGDKPVGTMWMSMEPSFLDVDHAYLYNRLDSYFGQSGSSVWRNSDGYIAGILSSETSAFNVARRINEEVIASLLEACTELDCSFNYAVEDPPPTPQPAPEPPPEPPSSDPSSPASETPVFATGPDAQRSIDNFFGTWSRTDQPVGTGNVNRTWMWGPSNNSAAIEEQYIGAPGNSRIVMYFDKSRMEDNQYRANPPWHVTNGLLVMELITGRMQIGDHDFISRNPADVQVAGDAHPDSPTYAMLDPLRTKQPHQVGEAVIRRLQPDGSTPHDNSLIDHHVVATHYVPETNHAIASVFWDFMNSSGLIYDEQGNLRHGNLFENPFFATGFPIIEPYWVHVPVGGQWQDVLLQCFERRCLTYTPGNSPSWQVEAGNVGQHYYRWRYGDSPAWP